MIYQKKLTSQVQCLLKLLKKVAVVPTNYFNNASEVLKLNLNILGMTHEFNP